MHGFAPISAYCMLDDIRLSVGWPMVSVTGRAVSNILGGGQHVLVLDNRPPVVAAVTR